MKFIPLTQGKEAIVDDEDFEWLSQYNWYFNDGYACREIRVAKKRLGYTRMHRDIMGNPVRRMVDHANRNGLDNRRCNLRLATKGQNNANAAKRDSVHSQFKGVSKCNGRKKPWIARASLSGKPRTIGFFATEEEAAIAYNVAAQLFYGEFARLNPV
jgi:hypothetical protein